MSREYTYAAAYVKSLEVNMLTDSDFSAALDYSEAELAEFLKSRGYEGDSLWEMLENERNKTWQICFDLCEGDEMLDVLMSENDYHNIKAVIKAVLAGEDWQELIYEPSGIACKALENAVKTNNFQTLDDRYAEVCREALEHYKKHGGQRMEIYLDKKRLEYIISASEKDGFVHGWAERKALAADLKIALRSEGAKEELPENALVKNSLIDTYALAHSGKSKEEILTDMGYSEEYKAFERSAAELEKQLDDVVTEYLKNARTEFFEFAPVLGYFEGKKTEFINIRLIAYGRRSGMEKEKIAERLRKTYV